MQMQIKRWVFAVLLLGAATVGAGAIIASTMIYHATGTNAFCTSCHSMSIQADDPYFKKSYYTMQQIFAAPEAPLPPAAPVAPVKRAALDPALRVR